MLIEYFDKQRLCIFTLKDIYVGECTFIKKNANLEHYKKTLLYLSNKIHLNIKEKSHSSWKALTSQVISKGLVTVQILVSA